MTTRTVVWAPRALDELDGATGLVECDEALARSLIASDAAQDPRVGARFLRPIEAGAPRRAGQGKPARELAGDAAEPPAAPRAARKVSK